METNVNYTIVGVFVIGLTLAIILGIVWLSAGLSFQQHNTFKVYMSEPVGGLNIDSPVEFNGVPVGTVDTIELNDKHPGIVRLLVKIISNTPVTKGTVAVLSSRGLTGITYLALRDTGTDPTPLTADPGEDYPVIKTEPSFYSRLEKAFNEITAELKKTSRSLNALFDPENREAFKQALANIRSISDTLVANDRQINAILQNTSKASQELQPLLQSGVNTLQQLGNATNNLNDITADVKQNPALLIRGRAQQALGPGEK